VCFGFVSKLVWNISHAKMNPARHYNEFDICGSVHHSIIRIENPTRSHSVSKFYFTFIWSSTCFGRHTAHHQEPETALAASGFSYVEGCWTRSCWPLSDGTCWLFFSCREFREVFVKKQIRECAFWNRRSRRFYCFSSTIEASWRKLNCIQQLRSAVTI